MRTHIELDNNLLHQEGRCEHGAGGIRQAPEAAKLARPARVSLVTNRDVLCCADGQIS